MGLYTAGMENFVAQYNVSGDLYSHIVNIMKTLPASDFVMLLTFATMVAFYATSFDSIAYTASCYSYHRLSDGQKPHKTIQLIWCILLIIMPIALVFSESSMNNLQSMSIVAAFPTGIVIVMIAAGFMRDAKRYMKEKDENIREVMSIKKTYEKE